MGLRSTSLAVLVSLLAGLAFSAPAGAASACKKRGTREVFKDGPVRILMTKSFEKHFYLCTKRFRRPRRWNDDGNDLSGPPRFRRFGNYIGYNWLVDLGEGGYEEIGWVSVKSGRTRSVELDLDPIGDIAVGPDGSMAYVEGDSREGEAIGYAPVVGKRRILADLPEGGVADRSLELSLTTVSWRTTSGEARSVPVTSSPNAWRFIREFEIPTKSSKPALMTAGPDGALWFTEYAANKIGRVGTDGSFREFRVPTSAGKPDWIAPGPDGALWFTEGAGNKIGRITTDGAISEFAIPTAKSMPTGIAAGPDGALWFLESESDKVGRITTSGSIREFRLPSRNLGLTGITAGPDGALWYTALGGGGDLTGSQRIGRITTAGAVTEFKLMYGVSSPAAIVAGPDGALWYADVGYNRIGRVTTDGKIREFVLPGTSAPTGITAGPDGALWYTDQSRNKIGRITTDGKVSEFRLPTDDAVPFGIAAGADGALWFTEYGANRIGRITTDAVP